MVDAELDRDRLEFEASAALLAAVEEEQFVLVLGAVVRQLLAEGHVDGLHADGRAVPKAGLIPSRRAAARER